MNAPLRFGLIALVIAAIASPAAAAMIEGHNVDGDDDLPDAFDQDIFYIVVQTRDTAGEIGFEVILSQDYKDRKKELYEQFKTAARGWLAERRRAKRAGEDFDAPKPQKPAIRKIGKLHKSPEEAEEFLAKAEAYWAKKMEKKRRRAMMKKQEEDGHRFGEKEEKRFDHRDKGDAGKEKKHAEHEEHREKKKHKEREKKHAEKDKGKQFDF